MGPRILLVDDSEELLSAYLAFLKGTTPYEVRTAASGHAALRILECWRPDIIVTDDTDDLVALIASLLANREPPDHVRAHTEARRLGILLHIAKRLEAVFSGFEGPGVLEGAGVLVADSWRHCLGPERLAAYSRLEQPEVGERALLSLMTALEGEPRRSCIGLLGARGLCPTDGGTALLGVVHWLLDSAMARGPATILHARLAPAAIDHRAAA